MPRLQPFTSRGLKALFVALLMGALGACAPTDDTIADDTSSARVPSELQPVMPAPQPLPTDALGRTQAAPEEDRMDACNADAARRFIGETATAEIVEQARKAAGAELARTLKPGQVVTMEYHPSRLNIDVDENNVVSNLRCG